MKTKINNDSNLNEIGNRIEKLISKSPYNKTETAAKLQITIQALSNILNGKTLISTKTLVKVAELFDVTIDYILTGKQSEDATFIKYQQITNEVQQVIKDMELPYQKGETEKLLQKLNMKNENQKIHLQMWKLISILASPGQLNHEEFDNTWFQLPEEKQSFLLTLHEKIYKILLKKKNEGGREQ